MYKVFITQKNIFFFVATAILILNCFNTLHASDSSNDYNQDKQGKTLLQLDSQEDSFLKEIDDRSNAFCLTRYPRIAHGYPADAISYWRCKANYLKREIIRLDPITQEYLRLTKYRNEEL